MTEATSHQTVKAPASVASCETPCVYLCTQLNVVQIPFCLWSCI